MAPKLSSPAREGTSSGPGKLTDCPVRGESLAGDLRTAAFAKLATKAAAVATAAVSSAPEVPGAVQVEIKPVAGARA
jgi:hypothetical protein